MKQSTFAIEKAFHVAVIMDGNGRWAEARGLPRLEGHRTGAGAVRRSVEAAPELGITTLTLHAFSSDNWKRPPGEVGELMSLFRHYLKAETAECVEHGIRVSVVGRRDRLAASVVQAIESAEQATLGGRNLHLRLVVDYSARDATLRAVHLLPTGGPIDQRAFARAMAQAIHANETTPDVDLLIRTGGEQRLSDLLGWDSAYAELLFLDKMWPDFEAGDLKAAVAQFQHRERRFGGLPRPSPNHLPLSLQARGD